MAIPKLKITVVRAARGKIRHELGRDGGASCGRRAPPRGWVLVSSAPAAVNCPGCRGGLP